MPYDFKAPAKHEDGTRPTKEEYYLQIALDVLARGTCLRNNFGAVIVNNEQIISTGYSGAPRGYPNCTNIGKCYREERGIPSGSTYEKCRSAHAEANAIIHAKRQDVLGSTLYLATVNYKTNEIGNAKSCKMCRRLVVNSGVKEIVYLKSDRSIVKEQISDWVKAAKENPFAELDETGY